MEEEVELCDVKISSSYEMPLVTTKEFENESVLKDTMRTSMIGLRS